MPAEFEHPPIPEQEAIRERLPEEVAELLDRERFFVRPKDEERMIQQIKEGRRFVYAVGEHEEDGERVERFLKIPINSAPEIDEAFRRQIELAKFLKQNGEVRTRGVIAANTERSSGTPFVIMETLPEADAKIGFIAHYDDMELLTAKEAQSSVRTIEAMHQIDMRSLSPELESVLQQFNGDYEGFREELIGMLDEKALALDSPAQQGEPFSDIINRRLGIQNFKERALALTEYWRDVIKGEQNKGTFLVHGDLSPSNLYVYDDGEVEFLDWEWSGISHNKAIAAIIDFGNLRARAWNNREFREALDDAMLESYRAQGKEEVGRAIVSLGILRSHMGLAGFFENYDLSKQREEMETKRRETTEADIIKAWEVAGLKLDDASS